MSTGSLHEFHFQSQLLKGNPMRNPSKRLLMVYTPPNFNHREKLPCILFLPGFGGGPEKWKNKDFPAYRLMDLMILSQSVPRSILCCIDGMTKLGGSQYLDSKLNGPFSLHIVKEIIPWLIKKFNVQNTFSISGHSSGGFGALTLASQYPHLFPRVASFAGDMHFELTHKHMLTDFINDFRKGKLGRTLNQCIKLKRFDYILGLSAAYSANLMNKDWKMDFPINLNTGEFNTSIWKKWLSYDPIEWIKTRKGALKKLDQLYLSCGEQDQFALHIGAETFVHRCKKEGIQAVYESHQGNHSLLIRQLERGISLLLNK